MASCPFQWFVLRKAFPALPTDVVGHIVRDFAPRFRGQFDGNVNLSRHVGDAVEMVVAQDVCKVAVFQDPHRCESKEILLYDRLDIASEWNPAGKVDLQDLRRGLADSNMVVWSPDGNFLAIVPASDILCIWHSATKQVQKMRIETGMDQRSGYIVAFTWSPRAQHFAISINTASGDFLMVYSRSDAGAWELTWKRQVDDLFSIAAWSPTRPQILTTGTLIVRIWSETAKNVWEQKVVAENERVSEVCWSPCGKFFSMIVEKLDQISVWTFSVDENCIFKELARDPIPDISISLSGGLCWSKCGKFLAVADIGILLVCRRLHSPPTRNFWDATFPVMKWNGQVWRPFWDNRGRLVAHVEEGAVIWS